uniref:Uncharacterized protein n=1 Tax=Glossina morsitans morsitans TaxID=37546 RepID=A0A1B0G8G6_GLOMM
MARGTLWLVSELHNKPANANQTKKETRTRSTGSGIMHFNAYGRTRVSDKKSKRYRGRIFRSLGWQNQWMKFLKNEPYKMFYKTSLDDSKFHVLDLSSKIGRPRMYENTKLLPLYTTTRPIKQEKHKDICVY